MADARPIQAAFTAGELSPDLYGRTDLARYSVGARKIRNCAVSAKGGAFNRAGLRFAGAVKDHSQTYRLAAFEAASDEAFLLVFGHNNVRPMFEGAYLDNGGSPYEITTEWDGSELADLYMEQSNDVMSIVHPLFSVRELSRFDVLDWRLSTVDFAPDVQAPNPLTVTGTEGYTGYGADKLKLFYTYKVASISATGEESLPSNPYTSNISLVLGYDQNYVTISWSPVGVVVAGMSAPTGSTGSANETQFSRTFSLTPTETITHIGVWSQSAVAGMKVKIAERTGAGAYTVNVNQSFNHPGGGWHDVLLNTPYLVPAGTHYAGVYSPVGIRETNSLTQSWNAGDLGAGPHVGVTEGTGSLASLRVRYQGVTGNEEVVSYIVYKEQNGLYGYIGETTATTFKDTNFAPSFANGPQSGANPFSGAGNYPRVVSFLQQRRVFANTLNNPQTTWLTQSGNFKNMGVAQPVKDSDAIEFTIASRKKQDVYHIVPLEKGMIVFTRSGEWRVTGREGDVLTPSSVLPTPQSAHGAHRYLKPIVAGEQILFVQREGQQILEMEYSLEVDRYRANDLTVLADHLFEGRSVVAWDYAKVRDGIIWAVMSDGTAVSLTYLKEHDVWGFAQHETKGRFLDVCVVPEDGRDVPYFIVQRRVGGATVQYVEYMADRHFTDMRDAFFVDSGLSYDNPLAVLSVAPGATTVVTVASGHGLSNGDTIELDDCDFFDEDGVLVFSLDGRWIVQGVTATTFRLTYETDQPTGELAGDNIDTSSYTFDDMDDGAVFRRCALTFTGFDHLAGRAVSVLADGNVVEGVSVDGAGAFTLDRRYARVHAGLSYRSYIHTLDLMNPQGNDAGMVKAVEQVFVRLRSSRGVQYGRSLDNLYEIKGNGYDAIEPEDKLHPLDIDGDWSDNNGVVFVQDYPLPMMVLGVTVGQQYGGT